MIQLGLIPFGCILVAVLLTGVLVGLELGEGDDMGGSSKPRGPSDEEKKLLSLQLAEQDRTEAALASRRAATVRRQRGRRSLLTGSEAGLPELGAKNG